MTDEELAMAWNARTVIGDGVAPAGTLSMRGGALVLKPSGLPVSAAAALLSPSLAQALQRPSSPAPPSLAALLERYDLGEFSPAGADEGLFKARLAACRSCELWSEQGASGRCASVRCHCSRRYVWPAVESCPEGKWPV